MPEPHKLGQSGEPGGVGAEEGHIELERSIDSIVVGIRHRKDPGEDVEPLMASIKRLGLLQPVTITPDGVLVCGLRRLEAVKRLGWHTLKVWVRSGISDELSRLLAQQDENEQRKPLNQLEQAALFRELRKLMAEDGARRQEASRFGSAGAPGEMNGAAAAAAPQAQQRGLGDSRRQAAVAVTGKASYSLLEQISAIERIAADRSLPETVRRIADAELEEIQRGGEVKPAYFRVLAAKDLIAVNTTTIPAGLMTDKELDALTVEAQERMVLNQGGTADAKPTEQSRPHRGVRAFLLTWGDLDGWSRLYDPAELATQLKPDDWEMFERVLAETIAFADQIRMMRTAPVPA